VNTIQLTGRLVRDPEVHRRDDGSNICVLRIAVDGMRRGGRDHTGYINIASFGKPAQAAADTVTKGWLVAITGRLQHETWETAEKTTRETYSVIGHVEFLAAPKCVENHTSPAEKSQREPQAVTVLAE
jgi:single-strand DNA-binding protein